MSDDNMKLMNTMSHICYYYCVPVHENRYWITFITWLKARI